MRRRAEFPFGKYVVWIAIIGAHVLLVEILSRGGNRGLIPSKSSEPRSVLFLFEAPPPSKDLHPQPASVEHSITPSRRARAAASGAITLPSESQSKNADADWAAEGERAAKEWVARQRDQEALRSFGRNPKGLGPLPSKPAVPRRGDVYRFEGGEVVEWINDRCYYSNQPPPGPTMGPGRLQLPICKRGGGTNWYQDFETWKKSRQ